MQIITHFRRLMPINRLFALAYSLCIFMFLRWNLPTNVNSSRALHTAVWLLTAHNNEIRWQEDDRREGEWRIDSGKKVSGKTITRRKKNNVHNMLMLFVENWNVNNIRFILIGSVPHEKCQYKQISGNFFSIQVVCKFGQWK